MKRMLRKKGFLIDKITEDSFYENLLLGITSVLKSCQFVSQINLERYPPATLEQITQWENGNYFALPEDLRNFFLSTDGFKFSYKFQYDKSEDDGHYAIGCIDINPLNLLERVDTVDTMLLTEGGQRISAQYSKIHVLCKLEDNNYVVLGQFPNKPPAIWLYHHLKNFYFLCKDFATYLRMALAHLGVPGWELAVLDASLSETSQEMLRILGPGIYDRTWVHTKTELNTIDPIIFKHDAEEETDEPKLSTRSFCDDLKDKTARHTTKKREPIKTPRRPKSYKL